MIGDKVQWLVSHLRKHAFLIFCTILAINGMMLMNRIPIPGPIYVMETPIDRSIPFIPIFIIPYLLYFVYVNATWLHILINHTAYIKACAAAIIYTGVMATLINIFAQTAAPRIELSLNSLWEYLLHWHYGLNYAFSSLPSQHVTQAIIASYFLAKIHGRSWFFYSIAIVISISTLVLKQHYFIDVLTSTILAVGSSIAFDYAFLHSSERQKIHTEALKISENTTYKAPGSNQPLKRYKAA